MYIQQTFIDMNWIINVHKGGHNPVHKGPDCEPLVQVNENSLAQKKTHLLQWNYLDE